MYNDWTQNAPMTGAGGNGYDWRKMTSGALGGIGGLIGGMMSGNGYDQMGNYIGQGRDAIQKNFDQGLGYLDPYNQAGMAAMGQYGQALGRMGNSTGFLNNIMNQYQTSPQAAYQSREMQRASNNAAAAGGQLGSPAEQMAMSRYQQGITSNDQQNWINNNLGINNQYLSGLQGLTGMGFNAAGQMNQNRMGLGENINNSYMNQGLAGMNGAAARGSGIGDLVGGIAGMFF